jgi:hypothetical protein
MNQGRADRRIPLLCATLLILWLLVTSLAGTLLAQSAEGTQAPSSETGNAVQSTDIVSDGQPTVRPQLSSVPRFMQDMRNTLGFSVGTYWAHAPGQFDSSTGQTTPAQPSLWTNPRLFANFRRKHSQIFLDYSYAYTAYSGQRQLNADSHNASFAFLRTISPRVSLQVSERLASSINDYGTFQGLTPVATNQVGLVQTLDVPRQRVTDNLLSSSLSYRMGRRNTVTLSASDELLHYSLAPGYLQAVSVGVQVSIQIGKWISLENGYTAYLNSVDERLRNGQIHSLQIGGLKFGHSLHGWQATLAAPIDATNTAGSTRVTLALQAGVSKRWQSSDFSLSYRRGFWTATGPGVVQGIVIDGHNAGLFFNQYVSSRITLGAGSNYSRGAALGTGSVIYVAATGQVGAAIQRHLMLTANYGYVSQQLRDISLDTQSVHRYGVGVGIQYFLPSLFRH